MVDVYCEYGVPVACVKHYTVYDNVYIVKFYSDPSPPCINYANIVDQGGEREQNVRYYWELTMTWGGTTIAIVRGGLRSGLAIYLIV